MKSIPPELVQSKFSIIADLVIIYFLIRKLTISYGEQVSSFIGGDVIPCERGKIEKWNFFNPSPDTHPMHWHLVNVQCGPNEDSINSNALYGNVVEDSHIEML